MDWSLYIRILNCSVSGKHSGKPAYENLQYITIISFIISILLLLFIYSVAHQLMLGAESKFPSVIK